MGNEKVLVLPGSNWQIPLIKKLKAIGYFVSVVNPYKDSPAFLYADHCLEADIFDLDTILSYCKKEGISAVMTDECDVAMPVVATLAKELKFSGLSTEAAGLFTNKYLMRELCSKYGYPCPEYKICTTMEEAMEFFKKMNTKLIMKPLDSNSSRGVFKVTSLQQIQQYFNTSMSFSRCQDAVLLERYIEGVEYTIDGIKTPSKHYSLAISEKRHFKHNTNIASELLFSYENPTVDYHKLQEINNRLIQESGLLFGLTHAEYKCEHGIFYLIEMAARGGGNLISSHIVPFLSGVDNYQYLIDCCMGNIQDKEFIIADHLKKRCAVLKFFNVEREGVIQEILGTDYLERTPQIVEFRFNYKAGDNISFAADDSLRSGFYIACCENREELDLIMKKVEQEVKITVS